MHEIKDNERTLIKSIKIILLFCLLKSVSIYSIGKNTTNIFQSEHFLKLLQSYGVSYNIFKEKDFEYFLNYNGGPLEPEWEWVTNISIVYTWVDGADNNFEDIKSKYNGGIKEMNSRDRDSNELCYSLRSLKKYLPWHKGTIFIVTNNQIPDWLNLNNSQIKIIDHKEIIPKHINPTFDSSTIECFLDKIPNITEFFIYLNDDVFFNNYVHPAFFFTSDNYYPKFYRLHKVDMNYTRIKEVIEINDMHDIYEGMVFNTYKIIKHYFDKNFTFYHVAHSAYICYRDLFDYFRKFYQNELKIVFSNRFRSPYKPITLYLYQSLIYFSIKNVNLMNLYPSSNNSIISNYSCVLIPNEISKLFIRFSFINDDSLANYKRFDYLFKNKNIFIYNINDKLTKDNSLYELTEFMMIRYPENTSFEKEEFVNLEKKYYNKLHFLNETIKYINDTDNNHNYYEYMFFNKQNSDYIKEYIEKRNELSFNHKKGSIDIEEEELELLLNYEGGDLEPRWKWIKNISLVYIIEAENVILEELKYSLRSISQYLPWFSGTVYIITENDGLFSYLKKDSEHLIFIEPTQFLPKKFHSFYNKQIIEMYLDKLPGITERFIYLKNNYFFRNMIHPTFFFNEDFFPKYNLGKGFQEKPNDIKKSNISFFNTYEYIYNFFGKNYVNYYRFFVEGPYPLYRDLFKPVRKLYLSKSNKDIFIKSDNFSKIEFLYLLVTYNIYGTDQIYYPNYVAGIGKIREFPPPLLNKNRTIKYYGFDIAKPEIMSKTIIKVILKNKIFNIIQTLMKTETLFFSLIIKKVLNEFEKKIINYFFNFLFKKKSNFEI